jgi:hypothetical protein
MKKDKRMENQIKNYLGTVQLGEPQYYHNIVLFPLQVHPNGVLSYITLAEAIAAGSFTVTETSETGSVPELFVINKGDTAVLLVDGEELIGAKQNRVLNTSVLVRGKTETKIPVSCVEQGRWSYNSAHFSSSTNFMDTKSRAMKSSSVSHSLKMSASYQSNQGEVWHGIRKLQAKAGFCSPTSAMNDVFKAKEEKLKECLTRFTCQPGQQGLIVLQNGQVAGLDLISRPEVYARLHEKFVRSYCIEGMLETAAEPEDPQIAREKARNFLDDIARAGEQKFQSAGYGWDFRLRADSLAGNALVADDHVIHAAAFKLEAAAQPAGDMAANIQRHRRYNH